MKNSFSAVRSDHEGQPGVETSKMFGSVGLKVAGKVFAMEVKGDLVVKLSPERAAKLVAAGQARVFDPGHGRPMKQWVAIAPGTKLDWRTLAEEAKAYCSTP